MRVVADFHHQGLYNSLHMLFEQRLGWELYRPIGKEWWAEGYWKVYNHPHTVEQFLGLHQGSYTPQDVHGASLPEIERKNLHYVIEDGIYYIQDLTYNTTHRAVRLDKFKNMEFDILLSSIPQHVAPYNQLLATFQPKAKHIFQIGNRWNSPGGVNNVMASCAPFRNGKNTIFYHQEFDLNIFKYEPPKFHNIVHSYIHYMKHPHLMTNIVGSIPGWVSAMHGAGMQYQLNGADAVADGMKRSAFTWHYKPGGDGFGHVIFSSYACGRPALIWRKHYQCCKADALFQDGITCIDTSIRNPQDVIKQLKRHSEPEEHAKMCEATYNRFKQVVDFDAEFEEIKKFLERLQ